MQILNTSLFSIALITIIFQLIVFYKKLGLKFLIHPGTYFALIWGVSTFSQNLLMQLNLAAIVDLPSILEINVFVICTSLFFTFWITLYPFNGYESIKKFNFQIKLNVLKALLKITLIGAILLMLYSWFKLGVTSLNISEIRALNTGNKNNYLGTSADPILSLLKYTQFFYPILTIIVGYLLGAKALAKENIKISNRYLYIPLIIAIVYVLTNGGRNPLFIGVKLYFIGLCFSFPGVMSKAKKKWIIKRIIYIFLGLMLFSTFISNSRSSYHKADSFSNNFDNPILKSISGIIEYTGAHYYGYQLRNTDTFDENKLGYGYFTFNGIFNIGLPFSSYTGVDKTLGNLVGFEDNPIDYFYLWENDKVGYFTTNSIYLDLKLDFGFYGTILFLFIFTRYTHKLFLNTQNTKPIGLFNILWFYLCFNFWASSNFKSFYATDIIGAIIMIFLFSKIFKKYKASPFILKTISTQTAINPNKD